MFWQKDLVIPKKGNTFEECEDSICIYPPKERTNIKNYKFAVSDGATESSFSKEWAALLTSSIKSKAHISIKNLLNFLPILQTEWKRDVFSRPLPYYAEIKANQGAFSTFIGLQIKRKEFLYKCIAIGDCCFFHLRESSIIKCFPIINSSEFGNNPYLISSNPSQNFELNKYLKETNGEIMYGDIFFLMSDALAHWFMSRYEQNDKPWEIILNLLKDCDCFLNNEIFEKWLENQRQKGFIKNDDTSIIAIEIK